MQSSIFGHLATSVGQLKSIFHRAISTHDLWPSSISVQHHTAMQALFVAWYNLVRKHKALKGKTPAMAGGLSDHAWSIK
jgi:hypothetical protein